MKAMILTKTADIEEMPLQLTEVPTPVPQANEILIKISACGVCHTDLDEVEGRLQPLKLPIIPGHQVVGIVADKGKNVTRFNINDRVGVTWLYQSCGECGFCNSGQENLCENAKWTGKDANGGYAEYMTIGEDFAHPIPARFSDYQAAPLLCAGVIGYRALRLCGIADGQTIGLFGFGASAHIAIQVIKYKWPKNKVFVFTRSSEHQKLAKKLGADWVGTIKDAIPTKLNRAIDFTPIGQAVADAMVLLDKGGRLVINAIRKFDKIPEMDYEKHLWNEKEIKSTANVSRLDAMEFLSLAAEIPIITDSEIFKLEKANEALKLLKQAKIKAAAVLKIA